MATAYRDFIPAEESKGAQGSVFVDFVPEAKPVEVEEAPVTEETIVEEEMEEVDASELSWNELRAIASDKGVYRPGMTKDEVISALTE